MFYDLDKIYGKVIVKSFWKVLREDWRPPATGPHFRKVIVLLLRRLSPCRRSKSLPCWTPRRVCAVITPLHMSRWVDGITRYASATKTEFIAHMVSDEYMINCQSDHLAMCNRYMPYNKLKHLSGATDRCFAVLWIFWSCCQAYFFFLFCSFSLSVSLHHVREIQYAPCHID